MNNSARRALDRALAAAARGMYSELLTAEDKERIAGMRTTDELAAFLSRSPAWRDAALMLQSGELTRRALRRGRRAAASTPTSRRLYRFANDMTRQFLTFITLDAELQAVMTRPPPRGEPAVRRGRRSPSRSRRRPAATCPGGGLEQAAPGRRPMRTASPPARADGIYAKPLAALDLRPKDRPARR